MNSAFRVRPAAIRSGAIGQHFSAREHFDHSKTFFGTCEKV